MLNQSTSTYIHHSKPTFKRRRPKFIDPTVYLAPDLQNMFSLGYFKDSKNEFPTGWVEVTEDKTYPSLASRSPIPPALPDDSGTDLEMTNRRTDSESSNDERVDNFAPATRMNEESSEDELSQPQTRSRVSLYPNPLSLTLSRTLFYFHLCLPSWP